MPKADRQTRGRDAEAGQAGALRQPPKPHQLSAASGSVALARSVAKRPKMLLDRPLGALDKKLRETQFELMDPQRGGLTTKWSLPTIRKRP